MFDDSSVKQRAFSPGPGPVVPPGPRGFETIPQRFAVFEGIAAGAFP